MGTADHIYVSRGPYTHHGIDAGDGTVIHFTGEPGTAKINAGIARTPMDDFLKGGALKVRRYGTRDDAATTIERAESRIGETGYHLVFNNCEHFATWCCTGRGASQQVRGVGTLTAHGAVAGGATAATAGVVTSLGVVNGLSGAGIMSALGSAGSAVGGAAMGPAVLGAIPAMASVGITQIALRDDETLPEDERGARRDGRVASVVGAAGATAGGVAAISAAGATTGLSAAGITSGLAAIGGTVGGGMLAGTTVVVAAPAVAAAGLATGVYLVARRLRRPPASPPPLDEQGSDGDDGADARSPSAS